MVKNFKAAVLFILVGQVLCLTPLCAETAGAVTSAPQAIETFFNKINAVKFPVSDASEYEKSTALADAYLDLAAMGRKALGDHWSVLSSEEQKAFTALLEKLVRAIAYPRAQKFLKAQTVAYAEPKTLERGVEVTSTAKSRETGLEVPIVYNLYRETEQWKIYDVFLDGISMTEDLQYQFDKLIADGGPAELLKQMQIRLDRAD
ncbi:MAG: ABC transporter substrate-binding protein, partial [Candidatus Omnitrophica bacterium]|nr:ABC transporter substrate-binding protein [Candidatus Omnitrophota bacterium]